MKQPVLGDMFSVRVEAMPKPLMSGLEAETFRTSREAAVSVEDTKAAQREAVYQCIRAAGASGCTDDELQVRLSLDGSSERPRRWELWKAGRIVIGKDSRGSAVTRQTRTGRQATVWLIR